MKILVVDDSAAIRKILIRVIGQTGIAVTEFHEAADGIEAFRKLHETTIDLVLADINMPSMDGLELLRSVRGIEEWKSLPFFVVTTEGGHAKVTEAVALGASGYIRKPFTPDQLKEKLAGFVN